jgi:hypothetical protein
LAGIGTLSSTLPSNLTSQELSFMEGTMHTQPLTKLANLGGGGGETEFEQAFSSLAYAYLRDKAPRLLDHMIGFQLVDRNEDNTKAVGIFGFQIDTQWLYAPVFFLNGDLKGHELLYMKNNDSFVPLKENWINYIMSRKPHVLGESSGVSKLRELGGMYPDIRSLSIPPTVGGGKRAQDDAWLRPVLPMLAAFKLKTASSLYREGGDRKLNQAAVVAEPFAAALTKAAQNLDFNRVLPQSLELLQAAHSWAERYPTIKQGMHKFYGVNCLSRWAGELRDNLTKQASNILPGPAAAPYMPGSLLIPTARPAAPVDHVKEGKLRLYVSEFVVSHGITTGERAQENRDDVTADLGSGSVDSSDLNQEERSRLMRDTVLISDGREDSETSKAYNVQLESKLTNPTETALYRVLEKPGEFCKMLVMTHGASNRGREPMVTLVRLEGSPKRWLNTHAGNVWADQVSERDEWYDWFDGLASGDDLKEGAEYIGVSVSGSGTVPFHVQQKYEDGRYRVDFRTNVHYDEPCPTTMSRKVPFSVEGYDMPSPYGAMLYVGKEGHRGTAIRAIGGELRVPADVKFLKLTEPQTPSYGELIPCCQESSRSDMPPIQLGKIDDIQLLFYEKTAQLKIHNNGTDVYVRSPLGQERMTKKAALWNLVSVHGLREKVAREILTQSERKGHSIYRIRYAEGYGTEKQANPNQSVLAGGPSAPLYDDYADERGMEQYGPNTSVATQYGSAGSYPVDELSSQKTDPAIWDNWQNYESGDLQQSVQTAQQASMSGQKEVFDTSMISGMLKSVRQDSLVERHLSSLVEALDALGRLLFNFYWHQEEFSDRYGKSDLPELEDSLRNAFESLGDITLFLKEKTIESPYDSGSINLEEAGRN